MYAPQPEETMTESEYLTFSANSDIKYEFSGGQIYAMTGGSVNHGIITMNIGTQLNLQLNDRDCRVTSSDVRILVMSKHAYRYPDVTVFCGKPEYAKGRTDTITNPILLVEVLSPSTALTDRNDKLAEYTQIESLQTYLLVSQQEARVEYYMRHQSNTWLYSVANGLDDMIALPSLSCTLALSKIYQKITFE
jgi:Uma2 family endonuclease